MNPAIKQASAVANWSSIGFALAGAGFYGLAVWFLSRNDYVALWGFFVVGTILFVSSSSILYKTTNQVNSNG